MAINQFLLDDKSKHRNDAIFNRATEDWIDVSFFSETFYFGILDRHNRLFFNLKDQSIWSYWLDEGSVAQVASSLAELIEGFVSFDQD